MHQIEAIVDKAEIAGAVVPCRLLLAKKQGTAYSFCPLDLRLRIRRS